MSDAAEGISSYMTFDQAQLINNVSIAGACVSIFICFVVFLLIGWCYSIPQARSRLNRISFRLLVWALGFELLYDAAYIASCLGDQEGPGCVAGLYALEALLAIVNYLCTCIGINLACTIVLGLNPIQLKLERWYIGVSLAIGLFIPIFPAMLGHFGYDPLFDICWYTASDRSTRFRWLLFDLYLWQILSSLIASITVIATLITLFMSGRATARAIFKKPHRHLYHSHSHNHEHNPQLDAEKQGHKGHFFFSRLHQCQECEHSEGTGEVVDHDGPIRGMTGMGQLQDKFFKIALRISMYPIALIAVNFLMSFGDLYIARQGGVQNQSEYILYFAYEVLYGARGIFFGALALADPCLIKGVRDAWRYRHRTFFRRSTQILSDTCQVHTGPVESTIPILISSASLDEKPTIIPSTSSALDYRPSVGSMDMFNALLMPLDHNPQNSSASGAYINTSHSSSTHHCPSSSILAEGSPEPRRISLPKLWGKRRLSSKKGMRTSGSVKSRDEIFTKSFAGVPTTSLPVGMTDEVDVHGNLSMQDAINGHEHDLILPVLSESIDPRTSLPHTPVTLESPVMITCPTVAAGPMTATLMTINTSTIPIADLPSEGAMISTENATVVVPDTPKADGTIVWEGDATLKKSPNLQTPSYYQQQNNRRGSIISLSRFATAASAGLVATQGLNVTFLNATPERPRVKIHDYYARSRVNLDRKVNSDGESGRGKGRKDSADDIEATAGSGKKMEMQEQRQERLEEEDGDQERGRSRVKEKRDSKGRTSYQHEQGHGHSDDGESGRGKTTERENCRGRDKEGKKVDDLDDVERNAFEHVQTLL